MMNRSHSSLEKQESKTSKSTTLRTAVLIALATAFSGCKEPKGNPNSAPRPQSVSTPVASAKGSLPPMCERNQRVDDSVHLEGEVKAKVLCVVDGDTFYVKLNETGEVADIRLWGVDCPESSPNKKCKKKGEEACAAENVRGKKTTQETRQLLSDPNITLEPPYQDNGKRRLAYVRLSNGIDLSRHLIEKCLCEEGYKNERKSEYKKAAKGCK
ncbi:thermonuclease family protein [Candidatus Peregrinibacteria bacterium]|nr:thermonuclease family protein [Candidatus Peregrinibacteria bacterium]